MKQVTGSDLCRALIRKGWMLARVKGSHHVFIKEGHKERVVIPVHGNQPLKIGLLRSQMKIAGLSEEDI